MYADEMTRRLHGTDIYAGFVPTFSEDLQGWNSHAPVFSDIIMRDRPRTVIDVGVWKGGSTVFLAELLRNAGIDGVVVAVDTFLGSVEHWTLEGDGASLIPRRHGLPLLYEQFLCNIVRRDLQHYVAPLPLTSDAAARVLHRAGIVADMIHIDAAHDYASVLQDARLYWNLLAPGGYLLGDDYHETWPDVVKAANEFAAEVALPLEVAGPKWVVRKG